MGTVLLCVQNELTGKIEKRRLEDVWYVPEARTNIIAFNNFQSRKYKVTLHGEEQSIAHVTKGNIKIKFNKINGLYRLWTQVYTGAGREILGVSLMDKRNKSKENKTLANYDCVPCEVAKAKQ